MNQSCTNHKLLNEIHLGSTNIEIKFKDEVSAHIYNTAWYGALNVGILSASQSNMTNQLED